MPPSAGRISSQLGERIALSSFSLLKAFELFSLLFLRSLTEHEVHHNVPAYFTEGIKRNIITFKNSFKVSRIAYTPLKKCSVVKLGSFTRQPVTRRVLEVEAGPQDFIFNKMEKSRESCGTARVQ